MAHTCTHPKIPKVPPALGKSEIYIQITLCKFVDKNNSKDNHRFKLDHDEMIVRVIFD